MPITHCNAARIRGVASCVPARRFDNLTETSGFEPEEVEKVVRMAGVKSRHLADDTTCSSDLCIAAARDLMNRLEWTPDSVDAVVLVTQTPDYFLPSTCCVAHRALGLRDSCAAFDVGLGCSGYPYGLWLATLMLAQPGFRRVLLLHGETPTRFSDKSDRSVALLFGDAGSATALEAVPESERAGLWWFSLATDGGGLNDLMIPAGGFRERFPADPRRCFVHMNGANVFNFTIKRVPPLIEETLRAAGLDKQAVDYFVFHQSNQFIMRHLAKKAGIDEGRMPMTIAEFGSAGGPSIPLTITRGQLARPPERALRLLLLGYGVGLSWGSALVDLAPDAVLTHSTWPAADAAVQQTMA